MGPLANDSPSRRAITVNEHDPYEDVPPIDVEPTSDLRVTVSICEQVAVHAGLALVAVLAGHAG